jgi:hypothetical protein
MGNYSSENFKIAKKLFKSGRDAEAEYIKSRAYKYYNYELSVGECEHRIEKDGKREGFCNDCESHFILLSDEDGVTYWEKL